MPTEKMKISEIVPKPCPFCGSKVSMTYHSAENSFCIWHIGVLCAVREPIKIGGEFVKSRAEAAEVWNRRVEK